MRSKQADVYRIQRRLFAVPVSTIPKVQRLSSLFLQSGQENSIVVTDAGPRFVRFVRVRNNRVRNR